MEEEKIVETEVVDKNEGYKNKTYKQSVKEATFNSLNGVLTICAFIAFLLLGILGNFWYCAWIVFFVPDIISSTVKAIQVRRFCVVNIVFVCLAVFFFVCMACPGRDANLWHPMWVIFFLIPLWYSIFGPIDNRIH